MPKILWGTVFLVLVTFLCTSCITVTAANLLSGEDPVHLRVRTDPTGTSTFELNGALVDGATLTGPAVRDGAGWVLTVTGLDWFNNWSNGWTRAHFAADGELSVQPGGPVTVRRVPVLDDPDQAKIRYFDRYLTGDEALGRFQNRWDRIQAVTTTLDTRFAGAWYATTYHSSHFFWTGPPGFVESTRRWLFPEVYGYDQAPAPGHPVQWAESIAWDTGYSRANFPENLRSVRDSGTLLQDFEECPELWRLASVWSQLWAVQIHGAKVVFEGT